MAAGLGAVMALTALGISRGQFSIGLFVAGNAILIQLYQPLNLLGTVYREITQGLVDMEAMFRLLNQPREVQDKPGAKPLIVSGGEIRFTSAIEERVGLDVAPERAVLGFADGRDLLRVGDAAHFVELDAELADTPAPALSRCLLEPSLELDDRIVRQIFAPQAAQVVLSSKIPDGHSCKGRI